MGNLQQAKELLHSIGAFAFFTLFIIYCNKPVPSTDQSTRFPPTKPAAEYHLFTQAQVDSLHVLTGKAIAPSLWRKLFEEDFKETPVLMLSGNLDPDPETEIAFWYYWEGPHPMGELCLLDQKQSNWKKIGTEYLDFCRGDTPPAMDTLHGILLTYSYGTGSGYSSEVLNFYQNRNDSLVCVFKLLELEGCHIPGCSAIRTIQSQYQFKESDQIIATYNYSVSTDEDSPYPGKTVFQKRLVIPFHWDSIQNRFFPKLPDGFPLLNSTEGFLDEGESSFDVFYEDELEKIKWHGPRWKQVALGNPEVH